MTGYENIYQQLLPRLQACNLAEQAAALGLEEAGGAVQVRFLGQDFRITNSGVEHLGDDKVHVNAMSALIYYITSPGRGEPSVEYVPPYHLSGAVKGRHDSTRVTRELLSVCRGDYTVFAAAAKKLGGRDDGVTGGRHVWTFDALPKVPVQLLFCEADEEFPAEIQVMVNKGSLQFLEYECLNVLVDRLLDRMMEVIQS